MKKNIWLLMVLLMVCIIGFAAAEEGEEYNPFDDPYAMLYNRDTLQGFFSCWAEKNIYDMPRYLIYEQKIGGETTTSLMKMLMESGTPLSYQINSVEGELGDDVMTYNCTVEIDPDDGMDPRYEQAAISMKAENGYYWIDIHSMIKRTPGEYDPEAETISLAENDILKKKLGRAVPIGQNCESEGFRVEVVSGRIDGNEITLFVSAEDLNGEYDGYALEPFDFNFDTGHEYTMVTMVCLDSDMKRHKGYTKYVFEIDEADQAEDYMLTVNLGTVQAVQKKNVDLIPYLKEYGKATEGIPVPDDTELIRQGKGSEEIMVLDCSQSLNIPLADGACLKGIGWINGQLHIQMTMDHNILDSFWIYDSLNQKQYTDSRLTRESPIIWKTDDSRDFYCEFIYDYKPEDLEKLRLYLSASSVYQREGGDWEIQFPLSMIYAGADE